MHRYRARSPLVRETVPRTAEDLKKIKIFREKVVWKIEESRHELLLHLKPLIRWWEGPIPDLRDNSRPGEIELLLVDSIAYSRGRYNLESERFMIDFVIDSSHEDEPVAVDGELSTRSF
ncbi:hypothetical protein TKK_0006570 [Trichogramma kaykai]